jgi:hypothetical protein
MSIFRWLFIFLVAMSLSSFIKPGLLKKIARCELYVNQDKIVPGNIVEVTIATILKDSTEILSSESNMDINFADYDFEIEGGATVYEKSRTAMKLLISDDHFMNPRVKLKITLRRKKRINYTVTLPIRYDVAQKVFFKGKDGYDPRANSNNGYRKIPIAGRVNLEFIDETQTLTNNSDPNIIGGRGPDMHVFISLLDTLPNQSFLKVNIHLETGDSIQKYLPVGMGFLEIYTIGGKGGISKYGGKGGKGGDVTVHITPAARPHFDQVFIINHGGDGGELWRPKVDGHQEGPYGDDGILKIVEWE